MKRLILRQKPRRIITEDHRLLLPEAKIKEEVSSKDGSSYSLIKSRASVVIMDLVGDSIAETSANGISHPPTSARKKDKIFQRTFMQKRLRKYTHYLKNITDRDGVTLHSYYENVSGIQLPRKSMLSYWSIDNTWDFVKSNQLFDKKIRSFSAKLESKERHLINIHRKHMSRIHQRASLEQGIKSAVRRRERKKDADDNGLQLKDDLRVMLQNIRQRLQTKEHFRIPSLKENSRKENNAVDLLLISDSKRWVNRKQAIKDELPPLKLLNLPLTI